MLDGAVRRTTGGVPPPRWRGAQRPSNIRLTCICAFAEAKRKAKLVRKLHKKGAALAATTQATFVTKQMAALKRVLGALFISIL